MCYLGYGHELAPVICIHYLHQDKFGLKEQLKTQMPPGWRKLYNRYLG